MNNILDLLEISGFNNIDYYNRIDSKYLIGFGDYKKDLLIFCNLEEPELKKSFIKQNILGDLKSKITGLLKSEGFVYDKISVIIVVDSLDKISRIEKEMKFYRCFFCSKNYISIYRKISKSMRSYTKFSIFKDFGHTFQINFGQVTGFKMIPSSDVSEVYLFPINAKSLLELSYVVRLETQNKIKTENEVIANYYQRLLEESKVNQIRSYIQQGKYFFNNILVTWKINPSDFSRDRGVRVYGSNNSAFGKIKLPKETASIRIIDGQHRLYGFSSVKDEFKNGTLLVVAFPERLPEEEAEAFVNINSKQTPVNTNILWDLYSITERGKKRGKISSFVKWFNGKSGNSYFQNKINIPSYSKPKGQMKIGNICKTLLDQKISLTKRKTVSGKISKFYELIENSLNRTWVDNFFLTNNGFNVAMRIFKMFGEKLPNEVTKTAFSAGLKSFFKNKDPQKIEADTSSEGSRGTISLDILKEAYYFEQGNSIEKILINKKILIEGLSDWQGTFETDLRFAIFKILNKIPGGFKWNISQIPQKVLDKEEKVRNTHHEDIAGFVQDIPVELTRLEYWCYSEIIKKNKTLFIDLSNFIKDIKNLNKIRVDSRHYRSGKFFTYDSKKEYIEKTMNMYPYIQKILNQT